MNFSSDLDIVLTLYPSIQVDDQTTRSLEEETRLCTAAYALGERGRRERNVETCAGRATSIHPVSAMTDDRHYDLSITIVPGIAAIPPSLPPPSPRANCNWWLTSIVHVDVTVRHRGCVWPITHSHQKSAAADRAANSAKPPLLLVPSCQRAAGSARRLTNRDERVDRFVSLSPFVRTLVIRRSISEKRIFDSTWNEWKKKGGMVFERFNGFA